MEVISVNNDYASGLRRLAAFFIDRLVLHVLVGIIFWSWWGPVFPIHYHYWDIMHWGILFSFHNLARETVITLYYSLMESSKYQATLGKIVLGIKVVDEYNHRISFSKALLRSLSKYISAFILMIGYIMIIFDERKQGLHDKIADTFVVKS